MMASESAIGTISVIILHAVAFLFLCPPKYSLKKVIIVWPSVFSVIGIVALVSAKTLSGNLGGFVAFFVSFVLCFITCILLSEYRVEKTIFIFLVYSQAFSIAVFIAGMISAMFFGDSVTVTIVIRTILHIVIVLFCITKMGTWFPRITKGITRGWWTLDIATICLMALLFVIQSKTYIDKNYNMLTISAFILIILTTIIVFITFFNTLYHINKETEEEKLQLKSSFLENQLLSMEEFIELAKKARHDVRHHNMQIAEYAKNGDCHKILEYLNQEEENINKEINEEKICQNIATNNILTAYGKKAQSYQIQVNYDVELPENIKIREFDLVSILANAIENAINGCLNSKKKEQTIDIYMRIKNSKLVIQIKNTAKENINFENGLPRSERGIGIKSILDNVKNYSGETNFKIEEGRFVAQILLKLPNKS